MCSQLPPVDHAHGLAFPSAPQCVGCLLEFVHMALSKPEVLQELQGAGESELSAKMHHVTKTRHILQYFGWTRVYGFAVVIIFAVMSLTLSSTSASTHNPLSIYTQNQYLYFVFLFVTALTGLDFFYEVLPFVTEADTEYGVVAADRLRKFSVLAYIIFVMISQYTT